MPDIFRRWFIFLCYVCVCVFLVGCSWHDGRARRETRNDNEVRLDRCIKNHLSENMPAFFAMLRSCTYGCLMAARLERRPVINSFVGPYYLLCLHELSHCDSFLSQADLFLELRARRTKAFVVRMWRYVGIGWLFGWLSGYLVNSVKILDCYEITTASILRYLPLLSNSLVMEILKL